MTGRNRWWLGLLWAGVAVAGGPAALPSDPLFDDQLLHEVELWMRPNDWATLQTHYQENTYYPVEFAWRGHRVEAAVRSRGYGSRNPQKPGLKIAFDHYDKRARFLGLNELVLDNVWQDPTAMSEWLTMRLFRRCGIPAPREAFARLKVNGEYRGLYLLVEEIGKPFLNRVFGEDDGFLYEFRWIAEWRFESLGEDPAAYVPLLFEPRTREKAPEPELVVEMVKAVNDSPPAEFDSRVAPYLDLGAMVDYWAVETFVGDGDGFFGDWAMNNFYVYRPAGSKRFLWIPWDKDYAFRKLDRPPEAGIEENVLGRKVMAIPAWRERFWSRLEELVEKEGNPEGGVAADARFALNLIRQAMAEDPFKCYPTAHFEGDAARIPTFITERGQFLREEHRKRLIPVESGKP